MSEIVTLEIPEKAVNHAREVAARTNRRSDDVLVEWIDRAVAEPPVKPLPDDQVLALCDMQMGAEQQEELSDLLARNREGLLNNSEQARLDDLMQVNTSAINHITTNGFGNQRSRSDRSNTAPEWQAAVSGNHTVAVICSLSFSA